MNGQRLGRFDIGNEGRFNGGKTYTWKGGVIPMPMKVYLAAVKYGGLRSGVKVGGKSAAAGSGKAAPEAKPTPGPVFKVYAGETVAGSEALAYRDRQLWSGAATEGDPEATLEWKSWSFFAGKATEGTALYTYAKGQFLRGAADGEPLLSVDNATLVVSRHSAAGTEPVGKWDSRDFCVFRDMQGKVLMTIAPVEVGGKRMDVPTKYFALWRLLSK